MNRLRWGRFNTRTHWTVKVAAITLLVALGLQGGRAAAFTPTQPRCDLGVNTERYNSQAPRARTIPDRNLIQPVGFTIQQWADKFTNPRFGLSSRQVANRVTIDEMYRRQILGGVLTQKLTPDSWLPMTDTGQCQTLAYQLQLARFVAARNHTAVQARANGYVRTGDTPLGGIGVHYQKVSLSNTFNPEQPAQILYDSASPTASIVGLSYFVMKADTTPPAGFAGPNDRWHRINHWCLDPLNSNTLIAAEVLSQQECEGLGGSHIVNPGFWTLHAWVVPGCESDWGVFSVSNPRIAYLPNGVTPLKGCDSNTDVGNLLKFDRAGSGPKVY